MYKPTLLLIVLLVVGKAADTDHPINDNMVNDIKEKTKNWEPHSP